MSPRVGLRCARAVPTLRADIALRWAYAMQRLMLAACTCVYRDEQDVAVMPEIKEAEALLDAVEVAAGRGDDVDALLARAEILVEALRRAIVEIDGPERDEARRLAS